MNTRLLGVGLIAATLLADAVGAGEPVAAAVVKERILAVNRPSAPYRIVDGAAEGVDLVADWRIVDAEWREIFAQAGLKKVFRILMRLDEANHHVRAQDHEYTVEWKEGSPTLLADAAEESHRYPTALPGGVAIAYCVLAGEQLEKNGTFWRSLRDGRTMRLAPEISRTAYDSRGYLLWVRQGALVAQRFDPGQGELAGEPFRSPNGWAPTPSDRGKAGSAPAQVWSPRASARPRPRSCAGATAPASGSRM